MLAGVLRLLCASHSGLLSATIDALLQMFKATSFIRSRRLKWIFHHNYVEKKRVRRAWRRELQGVSEKQKVAVMSERGALVKSHL